MFFLRALTVPTTEKGKDARKEKSYPGRRGLNRNNSQCVGLTFTVVGTPLPLKKNRGTPLI